MSAFLYTVAGIVFGGIISAAISYIFARRASRELRAVAADLRQETEDVKHYVNALISYLEGAGLIEVKRDEAGRPIKITIIRASAVMRGTSDMTAMAAVVHHEQSKDGPRPWWRRVFGG